MYPHTYTHVWVLLSAWRWDLSEVGLSFHYGTEFWPSGLLTSTSTHYSSLRPPSFRPNNNQEEGEFTVRWISGEKELQRVQPTQSSVNHIELFSSPFSYSLLCTFSSLWKLFIKTFSTSAPFFNGRLYLVSQGNTLLLKSLKSSSQWQFALYTYTGDINALSGRCI